MKKNQQETEGPCQTAAGRKTERQAGTRIERDGEREADGRRLHQEEEGGLRRGGGQGKRW